MRLAFFLLLLVNLAFYVWSAGFLGGQGGGHEPERLHQEISPEKIRIVSDRRPTPVKVDKKPIIACRAISGLGGTDVTAVETLLKGNEGVTVSSNAAPTVSAHWVLIPNLANRPLAEKKLAELRQLGVEDTKIINDEVSGPLVVSLGVFSTDKAAQDYLLALNKKGVRSARTEARERASSPATLEVHAANEFLERLPETLAAYAGVSIGACATASH